MHKIIAGNWKLNGSKELCKEFTDFFADFKSKNKIEIVVCPPFLYLDYLKENSKGNIKVGSQNVYKQETGAFTGEISAGMLNELKIDYAIVGHSERRSIFMESDDEIAEKLVVLGKFNITPILCVGETLEERKKGIEKSIVKDQLVRALSNYNKQNMLVIAYEPVWAIGTGVTASSGDAIEMAKYIREVLVEIYDLDKSRITHILYGGSVKPENAKELLDNSFIDGALIGGASLKIKDFSSIADY